MTFQEWYRSIEEMDRPQFTDYAGHRIVYSACPKLWRLSDYVVSSVSGELTRLVKRT